jgi:UDP-N-acetylmuramoyl-tripeptide--D-alanyl-D-alanine ligase
MMMLSDISQSVGGVLLGEDIKISSVSIDTRTVDKGELYIAIKGQNFDGHSFIENAENVGASAVLVDHQNETKLPQIIVKDTHLALAELAAAWKKKTSIKTFGVTGSNGKTTVKEMLAGILSVNASVLFTQGNLNNDIGVPLTLLKIQEDHQYAVIEMGANHAGEIKYSSQYAKPDVAVITNAGAAHIEGFGSLEGIAKAKGEIIESLGEKGVAVINQDDAFYPLWIKIAGDRKKLTFGMENTADIYAQDVVLRVEKETFVTQFVLTTATDNIAIKLHLAGQHNVMNALAAAACCISVEINLQQIKQGLEEIKPVLGRLQPMLSKKGNLIIDDTYNANLDSFKVAVNVLKQCDGEHWVVLGAIGEMGKESGTIHKQLGELLKSMNVARVLAIGSDAESSVEVFGKGATFFSSQEQIIAALNNELIGSETVLIKGSRAQKMEKIVAALVPDFRK